MPAGMGDGPADVRGDRRPALRDQLVVRLDAPPPPDPALSARARRSTTSTASGAATRPTTSQPSTRRCFPARRGSSSASGRPRYLADFWSIRLLRGRLLTRGSWSCSGIPSPATAPPRRRLQRMAEEQRGSGPAAIARRRDLARVLLPAASPRVRVLPSRAGAGPPVRALRPRPGRRDGAHLAVRRRRAPARAAGAPLEASAGRAAARPSSSRS